MNGKRGFTLVELLVVLAVFSLILAISVPNIANFTASLEKKHLDDAAEELFLLAQNHLAYLKSARSETILDEAYFTDGARVFYLFGDGFRSRLLPENAVLSANVVVVVDSRTMTATDVFYSEKLGIDELMELAVAAEDVSKNQSVGYYGGGCDVLNPRDNLLIPAVTVDNGNELYIVFSCDIPNFHNDAEYSVEATYSSENGTVTEKIYDFTFTGSALCGRVLIDKITADGGSYYMQRYAPLIGAPDSLTASVRIYQKTGDDINVTAELTALEQAVIFSPLFAKKSGSYVEIANARHLNNLRYIEDSAGTQVVQVCDIIFHNVLFPNGFEPISTFSGTFDGGDNLIASPTIKSADSCIGIFGKISGYVKNVHIVGTGESAICGEISSPARIGMLCAVAEVGSVIENCSASGLVLEVTAADGADVCIGGLVGDAKGKITRSSSACDISVSGGDSAKIGGLIGKLSGGTVEFSHSAGKLSFDGNGSNSHICGISAGSGEVSHCYSECSVGYVCGAEYYGIATPESNAESCCFLGENAWLATDSSGAVSCDELESLEIEGFAPAENSCPATEILQIGCSLPESVTVNGTPTRFCEPYLADPRGLVGIVKVEYSSGEYINNILACLDAYGNISARSPCISWNSPKGGDVKYYLYRSAGAHPENGEPMGWDCIFSVPVELGEESSCDGFVYQQILLGEGEINAELRFGEVRKTVALTNGQDASHLGKIGVAVVVSHIDFEYMDDIDIEEMLETYGISYYFYDFATNHDELRDFYYANSSEIPGAGGIAFSRETEEDDEVKIYVFADADSERKLESHFLLDALLSEPEEAEGIYYHEWLDEPSFDEEFSVTVSLGDGRYLTVPIVLNMDWNGLIGVRMEKGSIS